VTGDRN